ncbi:hypothetical protein ABIF64_000548 [Bradyrhizobium japonicum]
MAILATRGRDWAERTKRLAARPPDLDIFSQGLVERLNGGWRITEKGRGLLEFIEARLGQPDAASEPPVAEPLPAPRRHDSARLGRAQRRQRRRTARERAGESFLINLTSASPPKVEASGKTGNFHHRAELAATGCGRLERKDGRRRHGEKGGRDGLDRVPGGASRRRRSGQPPLPARALSAQETGRARERCRRTHQLRDSLPAPASRRRMLTGMKMFVARVVRESTRPSWTLLAISYLISAVIVMALRFVVGA